MIDLIVFGNQTNFLPIKKNSHKIHGNLLFFTWIEVVRAVIIGDTFCGNALHEINAPAANEIILRKR